MSNLTDACCIIQNKDCQLGFDVFVSVSVLSASLPGLVGNISSSQYLIIAVTQQFCFLLIG